MKLLSLLTLGLHFAAVMLLVGSLCLVIWHNWRGRSSKNLDQVTASWILAKRLPVIMTYVINLGVPPLLFLQVLYGRQIYSSSVIIGIPWIAVIGLLMVAYWFIYATGNRITNRKSAVPTAIASLLIVCEIGHIYAMNMTLMLNPTQWNAMYNASPSGAQFYNGDPTTGARMMFVLMGGPMLGGLWAALLGRMNYLEPGVQSILVKSGGKLAAFGALGMAFFGYRILSKQPTEVLERMNQMPLGTIGMWACAATILLAGVIGLWQGFAGRTNLAASIAGVTVGALAAVTSTLTRDAIRDASLARFGFDVHNVAVYPNWSVLIVFLLLFVIMLVVIGWLLMVMRKATVPQEQIQL